MIFHVVKNPERRTCNPNVPTIPWQMDGFFYNMLALHRQCSRLDNMIKECYTELEKSNELIITVTDMHGQQYTLTVRYGDDWSDWRSKSQMRFS
jgi:hypothetical protein